MGLGTACTRSPRSRWSTTAATSSFSPSIKWFVGLKFGAIIATVLLILFWSGADWSRTGARQPLSTAYILSLIGGVGGTVTLLSYGYWMREEGWSGAERIPSARGDLLVSFSLVMIFCLSMIFLSTQINWQGQILDEGPRLCLLLADRIGAGDRSASDGRCSCSASGAPRSRRCSASGTGCRFCSTTGCICGGAPPAGQQGGPYRSWAAYLTLAAISALVIKRSVWLVFVYTVVGSLFFPFVISTLLWLNNSRHLAQRFRNGIAVNFVLASALLLYAYLAYDALVPRVIAALVDSCA